MLLVAGLTAAPLSAQKAAPKKSRATRTPSPAPTPAATVTPVMTMSPSCTAQQYRQFDFWLGEWDLVGADGYAAAVAYMMLLILVFGTTVLFRYLHLRPGATR